MIEHLDNALREWMPHQRWYADKGREMTSLSIEVVATLPGADMTVEIGVVSIRFTDGTDARYQVPIALRSEFPPTLEHAVIGAHAREDGVRMTAYDALHDTEATARLYALLASGADVDRVRFGGKVSGDPLAGRLMGVEQSNSSVVYGDEYILKVFRKLAPGINPDLEVGRALAAVGCEVIAAPLAWFELTEGAEPVTLGVLQPFYRGGTDGWQLAITSVRDLLADPGNHADEAGGDFAPESERLGEMTAVLHRDLRTALGTEESAADDGRRTADQMLGRLSEATLVAPALLEYDAAIRAVFEFFAAAKSSGRLQRIHGDYHLGQVLRSHAGWVALDFEGEPAKTLAERRTPMSPLRDVAAMLRSFDYASRHHLVAQANPSEEVVERAHEWAERNRSAFCDGYARVLGLDPRDSGPLLAAYELDKAVYEVVYETRNRPTWTAIPLSSIARLVAA
ncbi:MAG: phosphotransferase [Actinomycetota bacterium]